MKIVDLGHLALSNDSIEVVVTPKASSNRIIIDSSDIRVYVTTIPKDGKATISVIKLLSKTIGVPKSKLKLLRGATSMRKLFLIED